ncbi:MAG TPA: efflux RND transporter periplasmic adaptor subunit [Arenimonas sp.]|nr:efflux RND transporter periplasmic adaptor subunit [Arenimonas sp.]
MNRSVSALAILLALSLAACGGKEEPGRGGASAVTVTTTVLAEQSWQDSIEALGTAQANEAVTITAKVTETVVGVNFEDGDLVEAGQVLVDLSGKAELAGLEEARAALREAEQQYRRGQELAQRQLIAGSQLDAQRATLDAARARLDAVRARLSDRVIIAPFAGMLGFRRVSPGSLVTPGAVIASLDDISVIKLEFAVPETYFASLKEGQDVRAHSAAFPGEEFRGVLRSIGSRVDPVTRAVSVRAEIPNPGHRLRPGMLMTVRLFQPSRQALVLPEISVVQVGQQSFVYRVGEGDQVERVDVRLGQRRSGEVEVLSGLAAGDRVVVDGTGKLRPGARISETPAVAADSSADGN